MADAPIIPAQPPVNPGEDYVSLREKGIALVQQLSGSIWTDYNEHDPGVTTLEQLCYALTELSYRAQFPVADLLTELHGRRPQIDTRQQALFPPDHIFPCNPLTEDDYRKLIVDAVPGVANVWLRPPTIIGLGSVKGLYEIVVYAPGQNAGGIASLVRRAYNRHRNLCEDLEWVAVLRSLSTTVIADVTVLSAAVVEIVLAQIFFNVGKLLAPELQRRSLKMELEAGKPPAEIFTGPLLRHGFIDDSQLQPKANSVLVNDIIRIIAGSRGVAGVRNVEVKVGNDSFRANNAIRVPEANYLQLNTRADALQNGFSIRLFKNGVEYKPDPALVQSELDTLWAEYRRTFPLHEQYEKFFGVPQGTFRDLERYYSIQNQYPNVYGISSYGVPADSSARRRGQAKQFKGYLLVFEQLLADYFAQLAHVKDLYSIKRDVHQTYFYQKLTHSVPNIAPLLKPEYGSELREIVRSEDPFLVRRNRFLDFLLALYAETLGTPLPPGSQIQHDEALLWSSINAKLDLLHKLIDATHNRGRGFDYLAEPSPENIAGMEIKSRIQLEMAMGPTINPLIAEMDKSFSLYIVEHILLRKGSSGDPMSTLSFTITVVFSASFWELLDPQIAREVIRQNTPAHIVAKICILKPAPMAQFESLYRRWRNALSEDNQLEIPGCSRDLRLFLQQNCPCLSATAKHWENPE